VTVRFRLALTVLLTGLFTAVVDQVDIGVAGVLSSPRPLGLAVPKQDQPMIADAHAHRLCPNL
jgi:hypothetical protein